MAIPDEVADLTASFLREADVRLPGRVQGLLLHGSLAWGELFPGSDVDFVAVWDRLPRDADLDDLASVHAVTRARHPDRTFDGFHCTADDLRRDPREVGTRPVFYEGAFAAAGAVDINPVTWCELAERPVVVRGAAPEVRADLDALVTYTRENLATYWRSQLEQVEAAGGDEAGALDGTITWIVLGPARLHHLLRHRRMTSKSGAGRYVRDELDPRWDRIAREALRLREDPASPSLYDDLEQRGRDATGLLRWIVEDGTRR